MVNRNIIIVCMIIIVGSAMADIAQTSGIETAPASGLLDVQWRNKTKPQKLEYIGQLKGFMEKCASDDQKLNIYIQIGDVYYNLESYAAMIQWYRKAVALNSAVCKNTPIEFRMEIGKKVLLRQNLIYALYAVYVTIIALSIFSIYRSKDFQPAIFIRRLLIVIPFFILGSVIVFLLDFAITSGSIAATIKNSGVVVPEPIVSFSIFDFSCLKPFVTIITLGLMPVLMALFYGSFTNRMTKSIIAVILALTVVSTWSHFILLNAFDKKFEKRLVTTNTHFFLKGELEDMLVDNPGKVLKANPSLLSSGNDDLEEFIRDKNIELLQK